VPTLLVEAFVNTSKQTLLWLNVLYIFSASFQFAEHDIIVLVC